MCIRDSDIAAALQNQCHVTPLAHLTCVSSTKEKVHHVLEELKEKNIENVLALRGDIPADGAIAVSYTHLDVYKRQPFNRKSAG